MKYHLKAKERRRFFEDKKLADTVNLTQAEYDYFDNLEYCLYKRSGKSCVNGGYCQLVIYENLATQILKFWDTYGTEGESWEQGDSHEFDRNTGKIVV